MKKSIFAVSTFFIVAATSLMSCSTPAEKVETAKANVVDANIDLDKAKQEYLADIEDFRITTAEKVAANEKSLAEFKERVAHDKKMAKKDYNKTIMALEKKNSDMKKKMDDYKEEGKDKWEGFKTEFNHDMDEMGKAFKDLTVKNTKQ